MLDASTTAQLKTYLEKVTMPIELVASLDDGPKSAQLAELLQETAALSDKVTYRRADDDPRRPSFRIERVGTDIRVQFAGIPMGHEFSSYVLALLQVGGHPVKVSDELAETIKNLDGDYRFETYMSLSCQNCPDVVQALNAMSVLNPRIRVVAIDGALFQDEVEQRKVLAVPTVYLNGELFDSGRMSIEQIVAKLDTGAADREAEKMKGKAPFDVLVVGAGPAGATAAIYAARKGLRTGLAAERIGGQVLDTMAIENFISVPHTEGPKLAAALEEHVREYDVDIMPMQEAVELTPATEPGGLTEIRFRNGATLSARSVVLATGARWRTMNVPGEQEYRNKGVTFCPHCDGPLFKGKRVAVIGGGNSGVEAAIDLAGVVGHVTLLEFDTKLRADAVLQRKLHSLPNVDVIVNAATTEVVGDGTQVTGLRYRDRDTDELHELPLEGVFVQIGLLPNTDWLKGTVELSERGEIVVDAAGATSVPGVFAAGDCTTAPYKQIVIAMGSGATASLSAFDHLIRTSAPAAG
ncbi:alkyl hydroperoxide reductase subunit F [uncultured Mycolicibacterium sp.]|uniref:alkyl hydroperoxide reductase subunit F n=1 Tax=uncultured Mycolicibacterium sp. TaxID=2320817 RepID=UPI002614BEA9|nr:alkyl hydroperoxide reductase subunit F [uncultured Mycolicibacterium sp.]